MDSVAALFDKPEFPRSGSYDPDWVMDNQMGPNALWLVEWLTESTSLERGMRVLDLGCGRAMTSVFLAKEFGVRVWAADLWIGPDGNWRRAQEAGVGDLVCPLRAEAHRLPFAQGFFDAVVSVDAYTYFGTDALYLDYLAGFVRPGGEFAVAVPGLTQEFDGAPPAHLTEPQSHGSAFWEDSCWCFKTPDWWERSWGRSNKVEQVHVRLQPDGWRHWRDFDRALDLADRQRFPSSVEALEADAGRFIGLVGITARRTDSPVENLYDPTIGVRYGVDE